jgi:hypothetical protein
MVPINRRQFIGTGLAGLGNLAFLQGLPPLTAQDVRVNPNRVQLNADIEPLVRLIEETPQNRLLEEVAARIRQGTSYQDILSALMLAGVRGIRPRPVGFKFHAVLVVWSAHQAAQAAADADRWLPLFWGLDYFKSSQAANQREGGWVMVPVNDAGLPPGHQARQRFIEAMDSWDEEGADRAITSFVRAAGATEVIETFWRLGARDFRSIGHKAIFVANGSRTLHAIGWRHAEPIMRSLAYALLANEGQNPSRNDLEPDRPGRENARRLAKIRASWQRGRVDSAATTALLATLRTGSWSDASEAVVDILNREVDPASVWDAVFLGAGELLMRQPGIVGIHCVTTANALYHGYQTSGSDETRRFLTLQAASFMPLFREAMRRRGAIGDQRIDTLDVMKPEGTGTDAINEILADVSRDRMSAARKTLALLGAGQAEPLMDAARRLIFVKGRDSHDYKFSSAALEDFYHVTPAWRNRFLATSMFNLHGSQDRDNDLIRRARAALG